MKRTILPDLLGILFFAALVGLLLAHLQRAFP